MFFSIVIPTYNREKIISRAINSLLSQTFSDFEIVIVDDGSKDDTERVVDLYKNPAIKYFKTENYGVAHARNFGIKQAKGNYVGFLDSDDLLKSDHLQIAYDFIQLKNSPEVVHLNFLWGMEDRSNSQKNHLPKALPEDIFKNCSLHVNCVFINAEIARQNLFNESKELMFAEDSDFFIKLAVRFNIHLLDKTSASVVDHEDRNMRKFRIQEMGAKLRRDVFKKFSNSNNVIDQYIKETLS
ncbi:MAG: glycosyltransferase family 2 protein [Burkholderiales bacterium]|nr:glycosyltransferase family 2 protein [Bacteroidia bacterium]